MSTNGSAGAEAIKSSVRDVIYRACLFLDNEDFNGWLTLCAPEFNYVIKTYSPEIRKEMTWYEQDAPGLAKMVEMLPRHNTDHGRLSRHVTVYAVDIDEANGEVREIEDQYNKGLITDGERYNKVVDIWAEVTDRIADEMLRELGTDEVTDANGNIRRVPSFNPIFMMEIGRAHV